ncbi:hypothetical protein Y1Q_0022922 [Alligator mississippiensis]|uniref:Uncharacterized protein n=1 Tax=Alligator mississippiensis TaxID=8496 RepID=A0A151MHV8_ALLMI|nr:hypothetical protein Y1Q_0022922 [Alligator mississippiensis]
MAAAEEKSQANWEELLKSAFTGQMNLERIFKNKGYLIEYPKLKKFQTYLKEVTDEEKKAIYEAYSKMFDISEGTEVMEKQIQNFRKGEKEGKSLSLTDLTDLQNIKSKIKNFMDSAQGMKQVFLQFIDQVHNQLCYCRNFKCDCEKVLKDVQVTLEREREKKEKAEQDQQRARQEMEKARIQIKEYLNSSPLWYDLKFMASFMEGSDGNHSNEPNLAKDQGSGLSERMKEDNDKAKGLVEALKKTSEAFRQSLNENKGQELIEFICNLTSYEQKKDDCKELMKILSEGLDNLEVLMSQWKNMVNFFETLESCLGQVNLNLDSVEVTQKFTKSNPNLPVYDQAIKSLHEAYLLSSTYIKLYDSAE